MPVLVTTDALQAGGVIESAYWLGESSPYGPPVLIDAVTGGQQASIRAASNTWAPFVRNAAVYKVAVGQQPGNQLTLICKSADGGATWTRLDVAAGPAFQRSSGWWDGADTVIVAYTTDNLPNLASIQFQNFDLVTETWGAPYGLVGAPSGNNVAAVWKRPDGTILVLYQNRNTFNPGDPSGIAYAVYDPGLAIWTLTNVDAGGNITLLPGWDPTQTRANSQQLTSYLDAAGNVGIFFNTLSVQVAPVIWGNRCFYQQIKADNSLGAFLDFPGQVQPLNAGKQDLVAFSGSPFGQPVIVGNTIVLPTLQTNRNVDPFPHEIAVLYLGTPVANPVWSTDNTKSIDPGVFIDDTIYPQESPSATFDGTTISMAFPAQDADGTNFARIRLCQTVNLASPADGWTASTIFDIEATVPGFNFPGQTLSSPAVFGAAAALAADCNNPPAAQVGAPYTHAFAAAGGTPPYTFAITAGSLPNGLSMSAAGVVTGTPFLPGSWSFTITVTDSLGAVSSVLCTIGVGAPLATTGGAPYQGCRRRNQFDWCMFMERLALQKIKFPPLCSIPQEYCNLLPWDEDFGANAIPAGAVPLHRVAGIVTPAPAAGDQVILEAHMPFGYDGLLAGIFHFYTGNGFQQGSGDILWRVRVNRRYVENLGNVEFTLGSPQSPCPLTEGQILLSGQTLRYIVNVPNLSGMIQVGQSQITAGLIGFLWPR